MAGHSILFAKNNLVANELVIVVSSIDPQNVNVYRNGGKKHRIVISADLLGNLK